MIDLRRTRTAGAVVLLVAIGTMAGAIAYSRSFVPLVPVLAEGSNWDYIEHPELLSPEFCRAFKEIATSCGYEVRTDARGEILISRSLRRNREMLWNLTTKADLAAHSQTSNADGVTPLAQHP